jgi:hypothetical protein
MVVFVYAVDNVMSLLLLFLRTSLEGDKGGCTT